MASALLGLLFLTDGAAASRAQTVDIDDLRARAEEGDDEAQLAMGVFFLTGDGVTQNGTEAVRWWRLAAEQGNVFAQHNLGMMYQGAPEPLRSDTDPPIDHTEAVRWFARAAEQDYLPALTTLAIKYRDGDGIPQNLADAFRWYLRAAELGDMTAMSETGSMYAAGRGTEQDDQQAYMWLHLATLHTGGGDREVLLIDREMVAERLTATQIAEAERLADAWTPAAADASR